MKLKTLGKSGAKWSGFETFKSPLHSQRVVCVSNEVTANCPVTGQPDWYRVEIDYMPAQLCVESKTLKLYLQSFRNKGLFCEAFADKICADLHSILKPVGIKVTVTQTPRGGVSIIATSSIEP